MACSISMFDLKGEWDKRTIDGHRVELVNATYKPVKYRGKVVRTPDLGVVTLYKVDGKFQGAVMNPDVEMVAEMAVPNYLAMQELKKRTAES